MQSESEVKEVLEVFGSAPESARRQNVRVFSCVHRELLSPRPAGRGSGTGSQTSYKPSGCASHCYRVARCVPTRRQRQVRQYGGGSFDFPRRVLLVTVLGGIPLSSSGKLTLIPVGVLAQRTVVVPQTVFSDRVVYVRVVQQG